MKLRITHTLGVISLVSMYAPTVVSEFSVKEGLYTQLQVVVDSCPKGDSLIVLGESIANTDTTQMAMSHVLVLTALDQKMKAPQCY